MPAREPLSPAVQECTLTWLHSQMTAEQLAKQLGLSRRALFALKKRYGPEAPQDFNDPEEWKAFIEAGRTDNRTKVDAKRPSTVDWNKHFVQFRALEKESKAALTAIELEATRRKILSQEEILQIFGHIGAVLRGKLLKLKNDIPSACAGLNEVGIEAVCQQKFDEIMGSFTLPADLFDPRSKV